MQLERSRTAEQAVPVPLPDTVEVLGVRLALTDYERALDWIESTVATRERAGTCACATSTP